MYPCYFPISVGPVRSRVARRSEAVDITRFRARRVRGWGGGRGGGGRGGPCAASTSCLAPGCPSDWTRASRTNLGDHCRNWLTVSACAPIVIPSEGSGALGP